MSDQAPPVPTYFHCAPIELGPGSIINPGNWGRIFDLYEAQPGSGLPTNVFKEALLEQARLLYAPQKPSRLASAFACLTLPEAIAFRNKHQKTNIIYEVRPTVPNPNMHLGDYELSIAPYPPRYFQSMLDQPRDYWMKPATSNLEILLECPVQIVAMVDRPI